MHCEHLKKLSWIFTNKVNSSSPSNMFEFHKKKYVLATCRKKPLVAHLNSTKKTLSNRVPRKNKVESQNKLIWIFKNN